VDGLNEALLAKAAEAKLLRCTRVRVDTTVVPSNVAYPTDAGLLAKAVGRIAATGRRIQAAGGATRTQLRDRSRAAGKRAHAIASKLRSRVAVGRDEAPAAVKKANAELADLAETDAEEPVGCWPTRNGRCGKPEPPRRNGSSTAGRTRSRVGVGVAWPVPSTILRSCWRRPDGSRPRLGSGWPGHPGRVDPAGQPARPRCPADREGPARQAGRVRPQSPSC
jgi:IS5 family transposase